MSGVDHANSEDNQLPTVSRGIQNGNANLCGQGLVDTTHEPQEHTLVHGLAQSTNGVDHLMTDKKGRTYSQSTEPHITAVF